jgi:serine/threonine protein kinase
MEYIEGVTLREFIRTTNPVSFRHKLIITLNLLNIVKEIHSRNIVHRHINPDNIMIRTPLVDAENNHHLLYNDKINLTLIGYSRACVTQDDELNNRMIFEDDRNHLWNTFYQTPQLEGQMSTDDLIRSPTIDTSCVCAVLFWMITKDDPKESRNIHIEAPHQRKEYIKLIHDELKRATGN